MATSGSVDFQHTRTDLIESALRKCGVLREGVSASANQLTSGSLALNSILKSFSSTGMPLWAIREGAIFPIHDINTVILGPSGGHAATTYVHTQLASAGASGATSLSVDSITGISNADTIGIELDSGNMHWTTVNGVPSGTTVVLTAGLASAAAIDSHIYTYTSKTVRPLKIIQAQRFDYTNNTEVPINIISRDEYVRLSDKTTEGPPTQIYYTLGVLTGTVNFFPRFPNGNEIIKIWFQRPFEDMDAAANTLDFPQEWEQAIIWELAATLGSEMGVPDRKLTMLLQKAALEKMKVEEFGMEEGSVYLTANTTGR